MVFDNRCLFFIFVLHSWIWLHLCDFIWLFLVVGDNRKQNCTSLLLYEKQVPEASMASSRTRQPRDVIQHRLGEFRTKLAGDGAHHRCVSGCWDWHRRVCHRGRVPAPEGLRPAVYDVPSDSGWWSGSWGKRPDNCIAHGVTECQFVIGSSTTFIILFTYFTVNFNINIRSRHAGD